MKVKTSITLSAELIRQIDALTGYYGTRSALIEQAVRVFLAAQTKRTREAQVALPRSLSQSPTDLLTWSPHARDPQT